MSFTEDPVINSPFAAPAFHFELDKDGQPTGLIQPGRRESLQVVPVPASRRGARQGELQLGEASEIKVNSLINSIRARVDLWRGGPQRWKGVGPETLRLLEHWTREDRSRKLFFCQVEALETLIYLTEVDPGRFRTDIEAANAEANPGLFRVASKMATGSGKTTVMAMIIAWHAANKARRRNSRQFTDAFLVVSPGITIRDRLQVLLPSDPKNVYEQLDLVPPDLLDAVRKARIVVTNYHAFMLRETEQLSKLNRQILGGRDGEKRFIETEGQMIARVAKSLMGRRDIVVLNDEAHHCYRHKVGGEESEKLDADGKAEADKNDEAARVWISGLEAFDRVLGVKTIYDVSATPFFLRGSGYPEGTLFQWVVSDFGLLDAIESGIVKVPRLPTLDDSIQGDLPKFRNVYEEIKKAGGQQLPRKGRGKQAASAMDPQNLPPLLQAAVEALYGNYDKTFQAWAAKPQLGRPPVFIVVCNNTATSKLIYDWMSGYDIVDPDSGEVLRGIAGRFPLFRNIDEAGNHASPMRTVLIDSEQLDAGDALSDEFLAAAAPEIEAFRQEMVRRGAGQADKLTPATILRQVMNTVGRPGELGAEIRCVVSVSMLTEGWDANTVTHIMGVRAFGTQLLCEQVVGRGLRRVSYEVDPQTGRFPVEYADVLGIPFTFAATGKDTAPKPPPTITRVTTKKDRPDLAIRFPRVEGYRVVFPRRPLRAAFGDDSRFELTPDMIPVITEVEPVVGEAITLDLRIDADKLRLKSVIFDVAGYTLRKYFRDEAGEIEVWRFPELARITEAWFDTQLDCRGETRPQFMKWRQFADQAADRIYRAVARSLEAAPEAREVRLPILDAYNPEGSTNHVDFTTSKTKLLKTVNSPITHVVADFDWELGFAEAMERMDGQVIAYAKNHNLHFEVPYENLGEMKRYRPDFIVRLDDGHGSADALNVVVEIKGQRDAADAAKADTMESLWVPAVNNARRFGRWAFVEIGQDRYETERAILAKAREPTLA
ncbi:MAG TPA: DEAD/DEAH box helicase family protein [Caulobacteraceae bacterium]